MKMRPAPALAVLIFALASCTTPAETAPQQANAAKDSAVVRTAQPPSQADLAAAANARASNPNRPAQWWPDISKQPDSFYRTAEGRRIAENMLSWQDKSAGGWPLMNTTREPFTGDVTKAGPWGKKAALIKATTNEMRFLARGYRATKDERYKTAVIGGLNFILAAQHPSGGWPHSYPLRDDYTHYATYNDDMMPDLMTLLSEVSTSADFELVGKDNRAKAKAALDKGVDFILKSQIKVGGKLTAWGQQHDEVTYEPRPARAFEPVAISGGESASVLHLLMSIPKPSPAVIASVEAGVQWYRDSQINGLRLKQTSAPNADRVVTPDPSAPPMWARFYQIGTGKPIFVGRDSVVRYSLAEIEQERRGGYAWYNTSGTGVFARYGAWKHERKWDAQPATNTDEAKAGSYTLPDLMKMADGSRVKTVKDWETRRRPEIMKLLEENQEGVTPTDKARTRIEIFEAGGVGLGGVAKRKQARIIFPDSPDGLMTIRVLLYTPAKAKGKVPTLLYLSFSPNVLNFDEPGLDEGMAWSAALKSRVPDREANKVGSFDAKYFVERGYGVAIVYHGDIYPDFDHGNREGVTSIASFGPVPAKRRPDEWGAVGAWAWGLSRVADYLETDSAVDYSKIALAGVSRLGKTVLWAGAQDKRFAVVIPMLSGEGGASISRRAYGETVADLTNPARYDYWFAPHYADYAFDVAKLPVDGHMLLAMIAPRPVLQIVGTKDTWSDPMGEYVSAKAAAPAWALYGRKKLAPAAYPTPDKPVLGDMGLLLHEGEHTTLPIDFKTMADFLDLHFGKPKL